MTLYIAVSPKGELNLNTAAFTREHCEELLRGGYWRDHGEEYLRELLGQGWKVKAFRCQEAGDE